MLGTAEVGKGEKVELAASCKSVRQSKAVAQNLEVWVESHDESVLLWKRRALLDERPALVAEHETEPPQADERRLSKVLPEACERQFVRLKLQLELIAQERRDSQDQDRLPAEFGRRSFLFRRHVSWHQGTPAGPLPELFRRKSGQLRGDWCRNEPQRTLPPER